MGRGCVNGELDTSSYGTPVPFVGLYITIATLVCLLFMTVDLVHGLFHKKPFVPCKWFTMNAFTLTMLGVATKIPADLITPMPRAEDQLSKLIGTAFLCTSIGFYMPSLGTMGTSERYGNLAALSVLAITMGVDLCIQMHTGVVFAFIIEHIIIMVCILVLLLLMWSSAIAFRGQRDSMRPYYTSKFLGPHRSKSSEDTDNANDTQRLRELLRDLYMISYTRNPQTLLCITSHHHAFGLLSAISSVVALQAMVRSLFLKNVSFHCNGFSDYRWSISILIVAQSLAILVGTVSIIYRWISFVSHIDRNYYLRAQEIRFNPELELEYLKLKTLSLRFGFLSKIMDLLILTQTVLYRCSTIFFGRPICTFKNFLEFITPLNRILRFNGWICEMAFKDMIRWEDTHGRDSLTQLIKLISDHDDDASESKYDDFIKELEATGKESIEKLNDVAEYKYRVSCVSVLVLLGMLEQLIPSSSHRESLDSLLKSLKESFEIIYYANQKTTDTHCTDDEVRWTAAKDVWAQWENHKHWFRSMITSCALKKSEESKSEVRDRREALDAVEKYIKNFRRPSKFLIRISSSLAYDHQSLIKTECLVICEFILKQKNIESDENLFVFLETCFVKMLCFNLSGLPRAILKEIDEDDPTKIGDGRVRNALKFFCKLDLLDRGTKIKWSWQSQAIDLHSALDSDPKVEADEDSNVNDGNVGNINDVSVTTFAAAAKDDDDTIQESCSERLFK